MRVNKQELIDALISWMRYKRNIIKVPNYCNAKVEKAIKSWNDKMLRMVIYQIFLTDFLFQSTSCPFCIANWNSCHICEYETINGCCKDAGGLWMEHRLYEIETKEKHEKRFNAIFKKLKKALCNERW